MSYDENEEMEYILKILNYNNGPILDVWLRLHAEHSRMEFLVKLDFSWAAEIFK